MAGDGAWVAAVSCALAVWLRLRPRVIHNRLPSARADDVQTDDCARERQDSPADVLQTMLILRLLRVALTQGSSIPAACEVVGAAVGGGVGTAVARVGNMMQRGVTWSDAWHIAEHEQSDHGTQIGSNSIASNHGINPTDANTTTVLAYIAVIRSALEPSWKHGDAPGIQLESTVEQLDRDARSAIERDAAKLSVKLLLPTGLCFLPAFIMIGVIPSIISFVM
ncbi:hypothetical protein [Bifidobacterium felsineum]|uniref:hypothetical protein n=1 Tax=Bifidobacterium felsineum TaxID=2045440 RepID=UPI001BDC5419|nr:hypothetical protein [Bifidobacterium felsineum]MBT1163186.1 hypothetical protein [Bifidobacterium felsineum]